MAQNDITDVIDASFSVEVEAFGEVNFRCASACTCCAGKAYNAGDQLQLVTEELCPGGKDMRVTEVLVLVYGGELKKAYKNLGDYNAERMKWVKAVKFYQTA